MSEQPAGADHVGDERARRPSPGRPADRSIDGRARRARVVMLLAVWVVGLFAGFYALLGIGTRFGCDRADDGLACHDGGSAVGALLVVAVVAIVTAVTVAAARRAPRAVALLAALGILALLLCFGGATLLIDTA